MRIREDDRPIYTFGYVDESGTSERFFGCGLLLHGPKVSGTEGEAINQRLSALKKLHGMDKRHDFGFSKTPPNPGQYFNFYKTCIGGFFLRSSLSFHALVVDTRKYPLDSRKFFRRRKDAGIDAFAYHLIRGRVLLRWPGGEQLYIRYDRRQRPKELDLRQFSRRLRNVTPETRLHAPRVRVRSVEGGRHPLIRICDLLLGCVTARQNKRKTSANKLELTANLERHLGRSCAAATSPSEQKFTVWHFEAK